MQICEAFQFFPFSAKTSIFLVLTGDFFFNHFELPGFIFPSVVLDKMLNVPMFQCSKIPLSQNSKISKAEKEPEDYTKIRKTP